MAWSRKTLLFKFVLFGKNDPYGKFFKIRFRKFSLWHRSMCCVQISWNWTDRKSVKLYVAYPTKNSPGSPAVATARIAPKICLCQPPTMSLECSGFHPNRFISGKVIAERVNTAKTRRKVNPIFGLCLCFEPNNEAKSKCSRPDLNIS